MSIPNVTTSTRSSRTGSSPGVEVDTCIRVQGQAPGAAARDHARRCGVDVQPARSAHAGAVADAFRAGGYDDAVPHGSSGASRRRSRTGRRCRSWRRKEGEGDARAWIVMVLLLCTLGPASAARRRTPAATRAPQTADSPAHWDFTAARVDADGARQSADCGRARGGARLPASAPGHTGQAAPPSSRPR